jgi:hypothetical protein
MAHPAASRCVSDPNISRRQISCGATVAGLTAMTKNDVDRSATRNLQRLARREESSLHVI